MPCFTSFYMGKTAEEIKTEIGKNCIYFEGCSKLGSEQYDCRFCEQFELSPTCECEHTFKLQAISRQEYKTYYPDRYEDPVSSYYPYIKRCTKCGFFARQIDTNNVALKKARRGSGYTRHYLWTKKR